MTAGQPNPEHTNKTKKRKRMNILEKAKKNGLVFDGAMGSMLINKGLADGEASELWNLQHPDRILDIHKAYFTAGADVACANTFGASPINLAKRGIAESAEALNRAGVKIARKASGKGQYVAGDIGSLGGMLHPQGEISIKSAVDCFCRQAGFIEAEGVDVFIVETAFDINVALAAIKAIGQVSSKPIFCTLTFQKMKKGFFTIFGNTPKDSMRVLAEAGAAAVGANCSLGSDTMVALAAEIRSSVDVPVIIQPNAGMPETTTDNRIFYPEDKDVFAENIKKIKDLGVEIVGGCCGTTPAYIRRIKEII